MPSAFWAVIVSPHGILLRKFSRERPLVLGVVDWVPSVTPLFPVLVGRDAKSFSHSSRAVACRCASVLPPIVVLRAI